MGKINDEAYSLVDITSLNTLDEKISIRQNSYKEKSVIWWYKTGQISWRITPPWSLQALKSSHTNHLKTFLKTLSMVEILWIDQQDYHKTLFARCLYLHFLKFMGIKQFSSNMFINVALDITCFHLNNTSSIILIDNCRWFNRIMVRCSPMDL